MIKLIIGLAIVSVLVLGREVGEYAEDVNPWNKHDVGNDFEEVE